MGTETSAAANAAPAVTESRPAIRLADMGSLFFGGRVLRDELGDTCHGDHGYAQYFVPEESRTLPLIMWHGLGQSGKTWESTPDGREGFWQIFTRRNWSTYLIDQPRRGRAGRAIIDPHETDPAIPNLVSEASTWETFRLGTWEPPGEPSFFPGLNFPTDPTSVDQFFRQQTPNTGHEPFPDLEHRRFLADAVSQLIDRVGPCVLMTHSMSGQYGWVTAMNRPGAVKAIVSLEPGEFSFPASDLPGPIPTTLDLVQEFMAPQAMPDEQFDRLTEIPIVMIFGDNVASEPSDAFGAELWRMTDIRAQQFVDTVNRRGGRATIVRLPELGMLGNTHFPMTDFNNVAVADLISAYLSEHALDGSDNPHRGPAW
ncbi:MAG: alpha/beta hydrolase [Actinomycetales bacterium]